MHFVFGAMHTSKILRSVGRNKHLESHSYDSPLNLDNSKLNQERKQIMKKTKRNVIFIPHTRLPSV